MTRDTSTAKTDHKVAWREVRCRQWCFLAYDEGKFSLHAGKENHTTDQKHLEIHTSSGIVRSTEEARDYIQEHGTDLHVALLEGSPSAPSFGRLCCAIGGYSYSCQTKGNPTLTQGKKTHHILYRQFRPSRGRHTQLKVTSSVRHHADTAPVPEKKGNKPC